MAIVKAAGLLMAATLDAASVVWMELAMFCVAATVYALYMGTSTRPRLGDGKGRKELHASRVDGRAALSAWQRAKSGRHDLEVDLVKVVDAMRKLGRTAPEIIDELKSALGSGNSSILRAVAALPGSLLRDDAVELLDGTLKLLEEHDQLAEPAIYAGLMGAQLRRRNHAAVAATAARLPSGALTPKIRAMLATAATHRGRLDEALGHLRQVPPPGEGTRCPLAPGSVMQLLGLALREGRVAAVSQELKRVSARMESRHLDDLLVDCRRKGPGAVSEVLEAGAILKVPKGAGAYQALAGTVAHSGDGAGLRALVEELEAEAGHGARGPLVSEPLALAALDACKALDQPELVLRVASLHHAVCAGAPGVRVLSSVCGALAACGRAEAACDFFEAEMVTKGLCPDAAAGSALLEAASRSNRGGLAARLQEQLKSTRASGLTGGGGSEIQREVALIRAHARERNLPAAEAVFRKLQASCSTPSPLVYNCYLDACVQCGNLEAAVAHFEDMKQLNILDVVGYNTLLKVHLSRGRTDKAQALLREMAARGLQANKVTYNELLHAKVIAKDYHGIWQVVDEMSQANVKANSVTCSILLKSLTMQSSIEDFKRILMLMGEVDEKVDEVLYSSVIEACIRAKKLDVLTDVMRQYRTKGGFMDMSAPTYGSMIKAYGQAGQVRRVHELWKEMAEQGVKPTSITLGCMVEALVANGEAEEAWELLHEQLQSEESRGYVNTVIYSTVLKGFAAMRCIDKVFAVYDEMRSNNIACNTITYNTLLDACAKACTMDRAGKLLEDMKEACVEPDIITYSTIVKGYCLGGDVDRAFQVLDEMKSDGKFVPDEIMYNSILDGCAKQNRVDEALRILEEMKAAGVGPSNYTLSILVKLLGHARRLNQAFKMVEDLSRQNGFRLNVQVYTCLVQACVLNRRLERALGLHDTMVADAGCKTDEKFYAVLAKGCLQLNQPLKAAEVVRAAYRLDGHTLGSPARKDAPPAGMDARALEEVASKLREGGTEERAVLEKLEADLLEHRGVRMGEARASGGRRGGGGQGGEARNAARRRPDGRAGGRGGPRGA